MRTEMYGVKEKEMGDGLLVEEHGRQGSSMDIGSRDSELEVLRERKKRLERAARLLQDRKQDRERKAEGEG